MASGRRVSLISRKQQTSRWGTFTTSGEKQARHQHLSCGIEGFRPTDGRTPAQERQVSWRLELQSSAQKLTQLFPDRPLRAHCTDAGAAKLSGDRSQSLSDAPLTGLAGPVEIPSLRIFVMRVVRLSPSLAAAPFGPPTTQLVSASDARVSQRIPMRCEAKLSFRTEAGQGRTMTSRVLNMSTSG